jgi:2'-hydroxyisoflavone reductase
MVDGVRDAIGSKATPVWAPTAFLEQQKVSAWADMPVWIPAEGDTAGASRRTNRKAIGAGLSFRPLDVTARETLAWFRTLPAERQAKLRAGIEPQREQQVLAALDAPPAKR